MLKSWSFRNLFNRKKALKVIDMIEDTILKCEAMRTGYSEYDFGAFVFDMPADKDVEVWMSY